MTHDLARLRSMIVERRDGRQRTLNAMGGFDTWGLLTAIRDECDAIIALIDDVSKEDRT